MDISLCKTYKLHHFVGLKAWLFAFKCLYNNNNNNSNNDNFNFNIF